MLQIWGGRLRAARIERNDSMQVFAARIGVSEGTVRDMERGARTVQIGTWLNALAALDRLDEVARVLERRESLIDRARRLAAEKPRARAYSRKRRP
ncbi:MAG: helix-turn-helix transcriptional regulator [Usitatibacter sp.]